MSNYSGKESQYICSRVPEPGSDPLIGSGWESGRDNPTHTNDWNYRNSMIIPSLEAWSDKRN